MNTFHFDNAFISNADIPSTLLYFSVVDSFFGQKYSRKKKGTGATGEPIRG
jgi:hypothetical protein